MGKKVTRIAIFFYALLLSSAVVGQTPTNNYDSVGYVRVEDARGVLLKEGSGLLIHSSGYILTAKHLFHNKKDSDVIKVSFKGRDNLIDSNLGECTENQLDYCLLEIDEDDVPEIQLPKLKCVVPRREHSITVAGYPSGASVPLLVNRGEVSAEELASEGKVLMSVSLARGMSGGPVYANGFVVGLIFAASGDVKAFNPISQASTLLVAAQVECAGPASGEQSMDIIYFKRAADAGRVEQALTNSNFTYRFQRSMEQVPSNILTCSPDIDIEKVKAVASALISAGINLRAIWPPAPLYTGIPNRMSIESYPRRDVRNAQPITLEQVASLQKCDYNNMTSERRIFFRTSNCSDLYNVIIAYVDAGTGQLKFSRATNVGRDYHEFTDTSGRPVITADDNVHYFIKNARTNQLANLGPPSRDFSFADGSQGSFYSRGTTFTMPCRG